MDIRRSIDIEYEIKKALNEYIPTYIRPLPEKYELPNLLITQVGGIDSDNIDTIDISIDARAETEAEASECLRNAIGILKAVAWKQETAIRYVEVNTAGSWGTDPVRPDLAMCTARVRVTAHQEVIEI